MAPDVRIGPSKSARPRPGARLALALIASLGAASCASTWPVEPGDPVELAPNEGLLVVHVRTNTDLQSIHISTLTAAQNLSEGSHLRMIGATAGTYRWSHVELPELNPFSYYFARSERLRFRFRGTEERLRFQVEPGAINYVGMMDIYRGGMLELRMAPIDRTAVALREIRETFPALVERYPVVYSGPGRHVFLRHLREAQERVGRSAEDHGVSR